MWPSDAARPGDFFWRLLMEYAIGVVHFLQLLFAQICNLVHDAGIFGVAPSTGWRWGCNPLIRG